MVVMLGDAAAVCSTTHWPASSPAPGGCVCMRPQQCVIIVTVSDSSARLSLGHKLVPFVVGAATPPPYCTRLITPSWCCMSQGGYGPSDDAALGGSVASPLRLSAGSPGLWQTPGSPVRDVSPVGPWTSITHNSLYNATPASTPPRPSGGAQAAGSSGPGAAAGCSPGDGGHTTPLSQWGSLSAVADPWPAEQQQQQQREEEAAQLHDAVLRSVLGVGLQQLRDGGEEVRVCGGGSRVVA